VIGRWYRNGYAAVSFGTPVSLRAYARERSLDFRRLTEEKRFAEVEALGTRLMRRVGKLVPVLPVSLVANVLVRADGRALAEAEIESRALALIEQVRGQGAHVHVPRGDISYAVRVGLRMLELRRIVEARNGKYQANPRETVLLRYYANAIAQHFASPPCASR
jgi:glycerol-3-phosphate O-acyltransferase